MRRAVTLGLFASFVCACGGEEQPAPPQPANGSVEADPTEQAPSDPSSPSDPSTPSHPVETAPEVDPAHPIALDTHIDTTQRLLDAGDDLADELPDGHVDFPRMRRGGLTGAFFSIWVDPDRYPGEQGHERALALIGAVRELAAAHPEQAVLCTSAEEVRAAHAASRIALLMGVEGAHALGDPEDDATLMARLRELHELGVRYMTVTWSNDNRLGHSSSDDQPELGLTDFGREAIREMNRLGMIVDVSHVSDQTFWDIVEVSERPLLASHSSCRALADHHRNMTDDMIRAVGEGGGAVCVNYYTQFIDPPYAARRRALEREHREAFRELRGRYAHSWQRWRPVNALAYQLDPDLPVPTVRTLGEHFAHVAEIAGAEAVCLGSDFDGIGELPRGMEDVADLGVLRAELERRELPVAPIFGENVLRVLAAQDR